MTSFCRITGCSRNLPKPCYFPLLPPITPAEAKKLCRITGKASEIHSYSPVIAFGKPIRFDGTEGCKITKNESLIYTRPVFEKTKDNENSYSHLETLLKKMKSKLKKQSETDREFVYYLSEQKTNLLVPPEMEEAIRKGELETVSVSKDCKFVNVKIKQGRIVKLNLRTLQFSEVEEREELYYGRGQNKDVMEEQQEILNERNKRKANTMARKQRFEALDAKAEAEELRDTVKPVYNKPRVKFNAKQRAEKLAKMEAMMREQAENKAILLPKVDTKKLQDEQLQYERFLADIMEAQVTSIKLVIVSSGLDWHAATAAENAGFDWESFPHEEWIDPVEVVESQVAKEEVMLRYDVTSLEIVVSVETVRPSLPMPEEVAREVYHMKDEVLKKTEHVTETLQSVRDAEMIPTFSEISKVAAGTETMEVGYLVKKKEGAEFVTKLDYVENEEEAVSGALVEIDEKKKFVAGQIIKLADQEAFVAGQTVETPQGKKFVPGQTIINKNGDINFVPGQSVKSLEEKIDFVAGQVFHSTNGPKFVAGQVMDLGDGKSVFVAGQTITTEDGPKFSPGEVTVNAYGEDIFVPGLKMPSAEGETFVTGQAFQSEEGLTFKPGQIMDTIEGPTFVPGKIFETPEGKKFIKGDLVQDEEGKLKFEHRPFEVPKISEWLVIPNKELQPLAFADRNVSGFIVNPTNTDTILVGEKLYGDMVETQNAVQFYLTGKLPKDVSPDSKVIPGQLIVNEVDKRFIPGKLMTTADGESFVPGQTVNTSHGEEFIPGQIVESSDGPKFVPGQVVMTAKGEKFVPGQVIVEDEGPKFVPGQIIQTKNGATFIPGQMMSTDEGQLFVPGQLVETNAGPRFVPGQVVESPEGPKFIPGTIIETDEGLKYVPPDADEIDEDFQISFQGFEISEEELALLMTNPADIRPHSPIMSDEGLIDSATLKKLAMNTVFIHGVTPEPPPPPPEKKKKKKKARVQLDAAEENGKEEVEEPDYGTDKVDVLLRFIRASTSISDVRRGKEMKKLSKLLGEREYDNMTLLQVDAMANILSTVNGTGEVVRVFLGEDEQLISDIVDYIDSTDTDAISRNDQARRTLRKAIQRVVSKYCDKEIDDIIHLLNINPENLLTNTRIQVLLTEAVGIVCVTGNVEVAAMLERFISEPSDPNALRDNPDVVSVLRQLVVLHQIAERDTDVAKMLQILQTNPEGLKDRKKVRELLKNANLLLKLPKVEDEDVSAFDLRHVASSKDIPAKIFEQIREDRKEADKFIDMLPDELFREIMQDKRCGESFLETLDSEKAGRAKSELDKFKKGMAIVVTKAEMQAVIPKEFARSICYGIVPYLLIDEEGFKFFERGLTGRKLAPAKVIENTWFMPDSYYAKKPSYERSMSGEQYSMVMLGKRRSSAARELLYTSLLPSSGPTRLSYSDGINGDLDDMLSYRRSSRASSSMWNDRKALNGYGDYTPQRRGSQALSDFDDLDLPSSMPRRSSRGVTDLAGIDAGSFIYRRPTREELDDYGTTYSAVMPCNPVVLDDVSEPTPLCRSDTVAKLLDKYTNFSTRREFGYHSPNSAWTRHVGQTRDFASRLPETRDVEPEPEDEDGFTPSDRAMMPTALSAKHRAISDTRDRSPQPLSANRDRSGFAEDTGLVPVGDSPKEGSRGLEGTYFPDTNLTRETSFIPQTRSSRSTVTPDEDPILSPLPTRRKPFRPAPQEETEQVQDPLEPVPQVGRPGGALQRYMEKRAREAQVIQNQSDPLDEVDFRSRALRSSRGRQLQEDRRAQPPSGKGWVDQDGDLGAPIPRDLHGRASQDLHRLVSEDRSAKGSQEQYGKTFQDPYERVSEDPYVKGPVDLYGRGSQDSHGRTSQDSYGRASQDTYGRPLQDPYGRASHDPYGRAPQDPYGTAPQDPYGRAAQDPYGRVSQEPYSRIKQEPYGQSRPDLNIRASQNTYGRDQGAEEAYGGRSLTGRYSSDDPTLGGYSQRRPAHSAALDGYNQEYSSYRGNYGTGNDTNYGGRGGYDTGVGYGSRYGSAYGGSRYGGNYAPSGGYGSSYDAGGGYGSIYDAGGSYGSSYDAGGSYGSSYDAGGSYGSSYDAGGGYGSSYGGGYSGTYRSTPNISTTGGYQVPPSSSGLGSGRQSVGRSLVTQNLLPNIDEEDSHTGRSLTPRQEERNRITILAQKYLNKPLGTTSND